MAVELWGPGGGPGAEGSCGPAVIGGGAALRHLALSGGRPVVVVVLRRGGGEAAAPWNGGWGPGWGRGRPRARRRRPQETATIRAGLGLWPASQWRMRGCGRVCGGAMDRPPPLRRPSFWRMLEARPLRTQGSDAAAAGTAGGAGAAGGLCSPPWHERREFGCHGGEICISAPGWG